MFYGFQIFPCSSGRNPSLRFVFFLNEDSEVALLHRFYARALGALLTLCLLPLSMLAEATPGEAAIPFSPSALTRTVTLPTGRRVQYYAQNDPVWDKARYELHNRERNRRTFGGGGCNPTSLAMAVATLVPEADLPRLASHTGGEDIVLCAGTVGDLYCANHDEDVKIALKSPAAFRTLLPLAFGHFALGFNEDGVKYRLKRGENGGGGGTTYRLFDKIAEVYGLSLSSSREDADMYATLDAGGMVVLLSAGAQQPFTEADGHYVVVADYDDTYIYLLDPIVCETYPRDKRHILEFVEGEPGVLRVPRDMIWRLCVSYYFCFLPPAR